MEGLGDDEQKKATNDNKEEEEECDSFFEELRDPVHSLIVIRGDERFMLADVDQDPNPHVFWDKEKRPKLTPAEINSFGFLKPPFCWQGGGG